MQPPRAGDALQKVPSPVSFAGPCTQQPRVRTPQVLGAGSGSVLSREGFDQPKEEGDGGGPAWVPVLV